MELNKKGLYESKDKMVSHPGHYQSSTGLEVIDVIEAFTEGLEGIEATDTGNIIKYACRWKDKNGIQDLEKILWYTQHLINHLKSENMKNENLKNNETIENYKSCADRNDFTTKIQSSMYGCKGEDVRPDNYKHALLDDIKWAQRPVKSRLKIKTKMEEINMDDGTMIIRPTTIAKEIGYIK